MATEDRSGVTTTYRPGAEVDESGLCYPGFGPGRIVIEAGSVVEEDTALIERDLIFNRDVEVELRGGTKIYTDVYRQADAAGSLHAIIAWSPYGKREGFIIFDGFPYRSDGRLRIWDVQEGGAGADLVEWIDGHVQAAPGEVYLGAGLFRLLGTPAVSPFFWAHPRGCRLPPWRGGPGNH